MRLCVKIGGAQLNRGEARAAFCRAVAAARGSGHEIAIVHGGGEQIRALTDRLGLAETRVQGLRVTDAATAEAALMVLGGQVNRTLVHALGRAGVPAVGLTGADGGTFSARPLDAALGYVGAVDRVDPGLCELLLEHRMVPVVASVAPLALPAAGSDETFYNINADQVVGPLARALRADAVLFLTDVDGVRGAGGTRLRHLPAGDAERLIASGVIAGGMIPKVRAALEATALNPDARVCIFPADADDAVRAALARDAEHGTTFTPDGAVERELMDEHVMRTYLRAEPRFVHGQGALLWDEHGQEYLDFLGGIAVSALGHAHPRLVAELRDQLGKVVHLSNLFRHPYTEDVAERLARMSGLEAVFFTNSGTESVEAALKLSRKHQRKAGRPERTGFVALEGSFHGRSFGSLSITSKESYRAPFEPLVPGVTFVPRDDVGVLERTLTAVPGPAALIVEPIQGEGGVRTLDPAFLRAARRLCDSTGTLLVHDEVQCGMGRTGKFLAADWEGVKPDLVTLAKPLAGGLPMGALLARKGLEDTFATGEHGSTFAGGPLVCRGARVLLDELENGLMDRVAAAGARLRSGLLGLAKEFPVVTEIRGRGLILGVRLAQGAQDLQKKLFAKRLITNCTSGDVIRLLPPYIVTDAQIDRALERFEEALAEL